MAEPLTLRERMAATAAAWDDSGHNPDKYVDLLRDRGLVTPEAARSLRVLPEPASPGARLGVAVARATDPGTSWSAARSVTGIRPLQAWVLERLRAVGPLTDEGIAMEWERGNGAMLERTRVSPSGLRTRRAELVDMGLVRDSGEKGRLPTGRLSIKWEAVPGDVKIVGTQEGIDAHE